MKKTVISLLGLAFIFLCFTTIAEAEQNKTEFAYYEGYGIGKFDSNDTFIPAKDMKPEDFKGLPYNWENGLNYTNIHLLGNSEPIPAVQYDSIMKTTGYWTNWKNHQPTNKEYFVEVTYPKNKLSKLIYGPFVYDGKLFYTYSIGSGGGVFWLIELPTKNIDFSQYPVLNEYKNATPPLPIYWYLDDNGKKIELGSLTWLSIIDQQIPGASKIDDISDSNVSILLELDDKLVTVPDIADPNRPLSSDTPNDVNNKTISSELALTQYPQTFNFGLRKVSAVDNEAVYTANQEPSSKTGEKEGIQVYDGRLTEQGYSVTAEFTGFQSNGKESLKGASIELADKKTSLSLTDASKFSAQQKGFTLSKNTAPMTVLDTDDAKFFTGNYWNESDVQLIIPKGSIEIGAHEGTVKWTLQTKPSV